jgi:phthiocerol/phenolphthiocerol synthesis type-I polyketide synthase D
VAGVLLLTPDEIDPAVPLTDAGLDSLVALELANALESDLGLVLEFPALAEYSTIQALATHLLQQAAEPPDDAPASPH